MGERKIEKILSANALKEVATLNDLPSEEVNEIVPSLEFEQKMKSLFAEAEKKEKRKKSLKRMGKIAASFVLVLSITMGVIMSADASRADFIHFFDRYFSFNSGKSEQWNTEFNTQIINQTHNVYLPIWVPDQYKAVESYQGQSDCTIVYKYKNEFIRFTQSTGAYKQLSDSEMNSLERLSISGQDYYYGVKANSGDQKLVWTMGGHTFTVLSNCSKDVILKFATNLQYKGE